jgi:hypothetical protein
MRVATLMISFAGVTWQEIGWELEGFLLSSQS